MATAVAHNNTTTNSFLRTIEGNARWTNGPVTYNIVQTANQAELDEFNNFLQPSVPMTQDFPTIWNTELGQALGLFRDVINLDLQLSNSITADFLIGRVDNPANFGAAGAPRNFITGGYTQDLMEFNAVLPEHVLNAEIGGGNDRFLTIIHELGHTLGLLHPHAEEDGTTSTGVHPDNQVAPYQWNHTIMSYTPPDNVPPVSNPVSASAYGRSVVPMALDIAALQNMYGANMTTRTGDTTYSLFDPNTTAIDLDGSNETIGVGRAYYGIWDAGGGSDVVRYDGASNVLINLMAATLDATPGAEITDQVAALMGTTAWGTLSAATQTEISDNNASAGGFFSSIVDATGTRIAGGYSIANGVVIEQATGGAGNDILVGNAANNVMRGNAGNDTMLGGNGDDILEGGTGNDAYIGGAGTDTADYSSASSAVTAYLQFSGRETGHGRDTFASIENLTGSNFNDRLIGDAAGNTLRGGTGNDVLKGKNGNDTFDGGSGNDRMTGGTDTDVMSGAGGWDSLFGLSGNDTLNGGNGRDFVYGGQGNDTVHGDAGNDEVRGNRGADTLFGDAGTDDIRGGGGNDTLNGGADGDFLFGENGNDTLYGGLGSDAMTGGAGTDRFVYTNTAGGGGGFDRIKDWQDGTDQIDLTAFGLTDFATEVQPLASNSGTNMRINFGNGDVILVENFSVANFDVSDVILM